MALMPHHDRHIDPTMRNDHATRRPTHQTHLIQGGDYIVAVDVELVIPSDDPAEPCYESETVQLLREVKERAEQGDVAWLKERGKVYAAVDHVA